MNDDFIKATQAGVIEMAHALKAGDIDTLVTPANTLQVATNNEKFVSLMLGVIFELLPKKAQKKILAADTTGAGNVIDLFTREPRD
jgi:hypothetical protein